MAWTPRILYAQHHSGLYIPVAPQSDPRQSLPELRYMMTTVGHRELGRDAPNLDSVLKVIRLYSLREIVSIVSRLQLGVYLWTRSSGHARAQHLILERVFLPDAARAISTRVSQVLATDPTHPEVVYFHSRQLLALLKLAFLALDPEAPSRNTPPEQLVYALLDLNDLIDSKAVGLDTSSREGRLALELYLFANACFNRGGNRSHRLARAYQMFIEPRPQLASHPAYVDVQEQLRRATGMAAEDLWAVLYSLSAGWLALQPKELDANMIARSKQAYFSTLSTLRPGEAEAWFQLVASDATSMQVAIRGTYSIDEPAFFHVLPFERTPLITFGDDVFCIAPDFLELLPGPSLEHRCLDPRVFSDNERQLYLNYRGALLQDYVIERLRSEFGGRVHDESAILPHIKNGKCCDAIIEYADKCILIECKANILPLPARTATDYATYSKYVRRLIHEAADQLAATAKALQSNTLAKLGLPAHRFRRVFPVLVTWDLAVVGLTYDEFVESGLATTAFGKLLRERRVAPLQLMDADEIELVFKASVQVDDLAKQIADKADDPRLRRISFNQFWHMHYPAVLREDNPELSATMDAAVQRTTRYMQSRGLPT